MKNITLIFVYIFLLLLLLQNSQIYSQTHNITGIVFNGITGKPIAGITVEVQGVKEKTKTTSNGEYKLQIPDTLKKITFADFAGMDIMEIKQLNSAEFNIYLMDLDKPDLSIEELMNIKVVTASKNIQSILQAPATTIVVTEDQIEARKYRSLLDVIQDLPDFVINDFVNTDNRNIISMRGFDNQSKFIILLNGIRISNAEGEVMPIFENYPVHLAKQIEIVYGPASALYGADAMAGVINIITKNIPLDKNAAIDFSPSIGMFGMANGTLYGGVRLNKDVSFYFSGQLYCEQLAPLNDIVQDKNKFDFSAQQTGQFNTIFGTVAPKAPFTNDLEYPVSAYNFYSAIKLKDFNFSVFTNMSQQSSSFPSTGNNAIYNDNVFLRNEITVFNASYVKNVGNFTLTSKLSTNTFEISPESNYRDAYDNLEPAYKYCLENMWEAEQQVSWQANSKFNLIGGVSFALSEDIPKTADLQNMVNENAPINGTIIGTALPNNPNGIQDDIYFLKYSNTGLYLQAQWGLSDNLSFTFGSRYDYNSRYGSTFNPRIGIVVSLSSKTTIKALYGSSFLAPSPISAYQHYGTFTSNDNGTTYQSSYWLLPNPNLKPIFSKTTELNIQQFITNNFSLSLSAYYIFVNNLYKFVPDAGNTNYYNGKYLDWNVGYIETTINQGNQMNYGFTCGLDYSLNVNKLNLRFFSSISYVNSLVQTDYTDANNNLKTKYAQTALTTPFISHIGCDFISGKFTISPRLTIVGKQAGADFVNPSNPDKRITIDGYDLLNLTLSYKPVKFLSIYCVTNNLLNSKYACTYSGVTANTSTYMYGAPQQPLRISGGIKIEL